MKEFDKRTVGHRPCHMATVNRICTHTSWLISMDVDSVSYFLFSCFFHCYRCCYSFFFCRTTLCLWHICLNVDLHSEDRTSSVYLKQSWKQKMLSVNFCSVVCPPSTDALKATKYSKPSEGTDE